MVCNRFKRNAVRMVALPPIIALLAFVFGVGLAQAEQQRAQRLAPVMVVLDASGSMKQQDSNGQARMTVAKRAMYTLIDDVPGDAEMGLTVYGTGTGDSPAEKEQGCQDVKTVRSVEPVDKPALRERVGEIEPSGYTPIGTSLRHAAGELPQDEKRAVVLISDGEDTCAPPPPCEVAKELSSQGVDLVVHTVGFKVQDKARSELECVAENTGGTYTEAPDSETLEQALPKITDRALRTYEAQGTPVEGAASSRNAPEIGPGQYVDSISAEETLHYRLNVPNGMRARIAATEVVPAEDGMSVGNNMELATKLLGSDDLTCDTGHGMAANRWSGPITAAMSWTNDEDAKCTPGADGQVEFTVSRTGRGDYPDGEHTLELVVVYEPPTQAETGPPGVDRDDVEKYVEPGAAQATPVDGGGSFNSAPTLDGSGLYTDTIKHGEWIAYRVPVKWGQALTYQVEVGDSSSSDIAGVQTEYYTPARAQPDGTDDSASAAYSGNSVTLDPVATPRVLYNNRTDDPEVDLAGPFYITIRMTNAEEQRDVPVTLKVNIAGEEVSGPDYARVGNYPGGPVWKSPDSETGRAGKPAPRANQSTEEGVPTWVWLAVGAGGAGATGLIFFGVALARRRGTAGPM